MKIIIYFDNIKKKEKNGYYIKHYHEKFQML